MPRRYPAFPSFSFEMNFSRPVVAQLWRLSLTTKVLFWRDVELLFNQMLRLHTPRIPEKLRDVTEDLLELYAFCDPRSFRQYISMSRSKIHMMVSRAEGRGEGGPPLSIVSKQYNIPCSESGSKMPTSVMRFVPRSFSASSNAVR